MATEQQKLQAMQKYVQDLIDGTIEPPNQYVGDMVEQLKQADSELVQIKSRIDGLQRDLQSAQGRQIALSAIMPS